MAKRQRRRRKTLQEKSKFPRWGWLAAGAVGLVILVAGLFYLGYQGQAIANGGIEGLEILTQQSRGHQDGDISYTRQVPAGGVHNPVWLHCGIYDEPVRAENAIHSMEHGAVWLTYQPELPAEEIEALRNLVRQERSQRGEGLIILSPSPGLESPVVATAWQVQLALESPFDERLQEFVGRYQRGPFTPEPGANCTFGGVGEPLSS